MTKRLLTIFVAAYAFTAVAVAQTPDLNGTWDHNALSFVRTQELGGGSVCILDCPQGQAAPGGNGAAVRAAVRGIASTFPKYKPEFLAKVKDLNDHQVQTDTVLQCQPRGVPRIGPPHKIVQNAHEVVFLYSDVNGGFFRIIPTDGRPHRKDVQRSYLGDGVGHWEGDTLVFTTVSLKGSKDNDVIVDRTGIVLSDASHATTRMRKIDADTIEAQMVIEDPKAFKAPWAVTKRYKKQPAGTWAWDYACAENNRNPITGSGKTLTLGPDGKPLDKKVD